MMRPDCPIERRLADIAVLDTAVLRTEWRQLYRATPPNRIGRDLLLLGVAWKMQERDHGGLGAAARRRLADLAQTIERDGDVTRNRVAQLKPGAKLVREWRGATHTVTVLEDGFDWNGRNWRSLSAIAQQITGGHWSGPRFFGLNGRGGQPAATGAGQNADG